MEVCQHHWEHLKMTLTELLSQLHPRRPVAVHLDSFSKLSERLNLASVSAFVNRALDDFNMDLKLLGQSVIQGSNLNNNNNKKNNDSCFWDTPVLASRIPGALGSYSQVTKESPQQSGIGLCSAESYMPHALHLLGTLYCLQFWPRADRYEFQMLQEPLYKLQQARHDGALSHVPRRGSYLDPRPLDLQVQASKNYIVILGGLEIKPQI